MRRDGSFYLVGPGISHWSSLQECLTKATYKYFQKTFLFVKRHKKVIQVIQKEAHRGGSGLEPRVISAHPVYDSEIYI